MKRIYVPRRGVFPIHSRRVDRTSRWGSPFKPVSWSGPFTEQEANKYYERYVREKLKKRPRFLDPLVGYDLSCCPPEKPCHVIDVLLRLIKEFYKATDIFCEQCSEITDHYQESHTVQTKRKSWRYWKLC